jgi:hypothetical protein
MSPFLFVVTFQIREPGRWPFHLIISLSRVVGVYFFLQRCTHMSCSIFNHLHQIFTLRTLLRRDGSLRPSPPAFFGQHTFFPLTRVILQPSLVPYHKNLLWIFLKVVSVISPRVLLRL